MPTTADPNAYLRTKVLTAPPEELRLMLFDGAVKFLSQGREALGRKDYEGWYVGLSKCRSILVELLTTLRRPDEDDGGLYAKLSALYTFMYSLLIQANLEKDVSKVDKVLELLEFERETWILAMRKLAEERGAAAGTPDDAARSAVAEETAAASKVASVPRYRPLSVQG